MIKYWARYFWVVKITISLPPRKSVVCTCIDSHFICEQCDIILDINSGDIRIRNAPQRQRACGAERCIMELWCLAGHVRQEQSTQQIRWCFCSYTLIPHHAMPQKTFMYTCKEWNKFRGWWVIVGNAHHNAL